MDNIVNTKCEICGCQTARIEIKKYDTGVCKEGYCTNCGKLIIFECIEPNKDFVPKSTTPTVTCPYCSSTNCKKISTASKIGKVAMWGVLAAGSVGHTWHCNSCGSNFG